MSGNGTEGDLCILGRGINEKILHDETHTNFSSQNIVMCMSDYRRGLDW
jgi:hypothetical protein